MQAYFCKSQRQTDTYVHLAARDDFTPLPKALRAWLAALRFVLDLTFARERSLARPHAATERENLVLHGYHLPLTSASCLGPLPQDRTTDA